MAGRLLERENELRTLAVAVEAAATEGGRVVLVLGEAGIGKTSLVRTFLQSMDGSARVLAGACDDLVTPRTFGPLRDAVMDAGGPLAKALTGEPDRESVYSALLRELSGSVPTVLVVEDVHWADDATLDALRYVVRRLERLRAVVLLTYREDETGPDHPLRRVLGMLGAADVCRLALRPLSPDAVAALGADVGADGAAVYATTGGNPFFVTEALASPGDHVPATVVDAVMARISQVAPPVRHALDHLAVVPSHVERWLAEALLGDLGVLAEAEQRGIVELRPDGLAFRHELARRALEQSLPRAKRLPLHRAVVDALLERGDADLSRLVHHAVAAGDVATVLARGPAAAREAAAAGSHRQALAHYEHVMPHADTLPDDARAQLLVEYAWQLYAAQRFVDALAIAERAVTLWERLGDPVAMGEALVAVSRTAYMADRPVAATRAVERAAAVLEPTGNLSALAYARTYLGAVLALTDRQQDALELLPHGCELAERAGRRDLHALCLNYCGCARVDLGDERGVEDLRASLALARSLSHHEYVARAYTNLAEKLYELREYDALAACIAEGLPFALEHDLPGHAYNLRAHRALLGSVRGDWDGAAAELRDLLSTVPDPGQSGRVALPALGRLLARRGDPQAESVTARAWQVALRADAVQALAPAGIARIEWAWLIGDPDRAAEQVDVLLRRTGGVAGRRPRGELLRYLSRAGRPAEPFPGCPQEWAAGLRGDWRAAAALWERIGDPYERALELAGSNEGAPMLEALHLLDRLGATAAAALVRRRLREAGVTGIPRRRRPTVQENPSGLTERQLDVLGLLADGLTNAEIAGRLVLSTRTVDHHVSAILTRLGVATRREAARAAAQLDLPRR